MKIELYPEQQDAVNNLKTGSILCGDVGSGKSITSLAYYFKSCGGEYYPEYKPMTNPKSLYIITTPKKRDSLEWEREYSRFALSRNKKSMRYNIDVVVDSWNNIRKYIGITNSFFIFDEQRVIGQGSWVKSFLQIVKRNEWILLSATPGDTWIDYIPVFIANGFYRNRTEFIRNHVVYNTHVKFPKIDRYLHEYILEKYRQQIMVRINYTHKIEKHEEQLIVTYDKEQYDMVLKQRWNVYEDRPIQNVSELCNVIRRVVNEDQSRIDMAESIMTKNDKLIVFYNFTYELNILRDICKRKNIPFAEWNGQKHQAIPQGNRWVYLVQYLAGAEGWECIRTNKMLFYSLNYSYRLMHQAEGRIDRMNTPYYDLYYYKILSDSTIDRLVNEAVIKKRNFNARCFNHFLDS